MRGSTGSRPAQAGGLLGRLRGIRKNEVPRIASMQATSAFMPD
jgi:hypothetical protein